MKPIEVELRLTLLREHLAAVLAPYEGRVWNEKTFYEVTAAVRAAMVFIDTTSGLWPHLSALFEPDVDMGSDGVLVCSFRRKVTYD